MNRAAGGGSGRRRLSRVKCTGPPPRKRSRWRRSYAGKGKCAARLAKLNRWKQAIVQRQRRRRRSRAAFNSGRFALKILRSCLEPFAAHIV
ncbi:hypothetical protein EVAR_61988_1 [Eumeta japonica]|uniref:Uncharacterized protein n=1 Tax=Eumeta variegata TaxID=151549 RepID=A0A4C1YDP4_EUMVA|nr:hypothetical protein EVAR_61988_1 [Eumeta japonica]